MSLTRDLARYVVAQRRFAFAACTRGVEMGENPGREYVRLEREYMRAIHNRKWLEWALGHTWGMRIVMSWIN